MKLTCGKCKHELQIDDSRVPAGAAFKVKCPKCSESITARGPSKESAPPAPPPSRPAPPEPPAASDAEWERFKPFVEEYVNLRIAALKQEIEAMVGASADRSMGESGSSAPSVPGGRALVCEANSRIVQSVAGIIQRMDYQVDTVKSAADALRMMDDTSYELIATGPSFPEDPTGGKKILEKINARKFDLRRLTFVVLISPELDTTGPQNAFLHGANLIVNIRDLKDLERLIGQGQQDFQKLSG